MATSVLQFKNSTPQSMKDKKLYDDNKFTGDDLQDVLDGLLKLGVSDHNNANNNNNNNNNNTSHKPVMRPTSLSPLPRPLPRIISSTSHNNTNDTNNTNNTNNNDNNNNSCNRHNPSYQQQPSFIASCKTYQNTNKMNHFAGFNLLYEAAKKVEGVTHFKMDIADIERITHKMDTNEMDNDLTYNSHSGILKKKSKNGISPPVINSIHELMEPTNCNTSNISNMTFADLNDDFTMDMTMQEHKRDSSMSNIAQKLRLSEISSIGRRSSMRMPLSLSPNKLSIKEQQIQNRRLSREWSNTNIKEMDKIYDEKSKLATNNNNNNNQSNNNNNNIQNKNNNNNQNKNSNLLNNSSHQICDEFSESNIGLATVINTYKENIEKVKQYHNKNRSMPRQKQNEMLQQQLQIMEAKIQQQKQKEIEMEKRRKIQQEKRKKDQQFLEQEKKKRNEIEKQKMIQKEREMKANSNPNNNPNNNTNNMNNNQNNQNNNINFDSKQQWYPNENELALISKKYKEMYKQCENLTNSFCSQNSNLQADFEMHIGLIVRSISSNQKSVFDAYKRFSKLVNQKTQMDSMERRYCFIEITRLIITDVRIVKSSAQKFASSYFLSFIMNEYKSQYFDIFKCMFYHQCIWTVPYINKQLRDIKISKPNFDNNTASIVRCVLLGYNAIKNIDMVPKEKRKYLQVFNKENNAGTCIFESENKYFTRTQHICGLFAAFMSIRNNNKFTNPFGIDSGHCWQWIAYLLCLPPCVYPELCSILSGIIQIIGYDMLSKYPKQFPKIIKFIQQNIYPQCNGSSTTSAKAKRELNLFLRQCQDSMMKNNGKLIIKKPNESKLIAKTVGASALTNIR